jgi:hypothetical protein
MRLDRFDAFHAAIQPMEEQLSRSSSGREGAHVLDGVAQLGVRVVLHAAMPTSPTPVGQLDDPEEPRHPGSLATADPVR